MMRALREQGWKMVQNLRYKLELGNTMSCSGYIDFERLMGQQP